MLRTKITQKVHIDKLKLIDDKLEDLKEKTKEGLTPSERIYFERISLRVL